MPRSPGSMMLALFLLASSSGAAGAIGTDDGAEMRRGIQAREIGNVYESVSILEPVARHATDPAVRLDASIELGLSLIQGNRYGEARKLLLETLPATKSPVTERIDLALGNIAVHEGDAELARGYYRQVLDSEALAGDSGTKLSAQVNLVRLMPQSQRLTAMESLLPRLLESGRTKSSSRALLRLGREAAALYPQQAVYVAPDSPGNTAILPNELDKALSIAYRADSAANLLGRENGDAYLAAQASEAIAELYELQARDREALSLNRAAIDLAAKLPQGQSEYLLATLEWRSARLHRRLGNDAAALASYLRSARHLDAIRQDLPIQDAEGTSTYASILRPLFAGLADLTLRDIDARPAAEQPLRLANALSVIELSHQAELQDYLGDRCSVDAIRQVANRPLIADTAVIYPIVFKDRLEVLVRTSTGILRHSTIVSAAILDDEVRDFRAALLDYGSKDYQAASQPFYAMLIAPFEAALASAHVTNLVIVPDGALRLIPAAAVYDGRRFLAERFTISTVTGLTMTEAALQRGSKPTSLIVGLSSPGPVAERLVGMGFNGNAVLSDGNNTGEGAGPAGASGGAADAAALKDKLALPGVKAEIESIAPMLRGRSLLDRDFTKARFEREVQTGGYRIVHIASHGFFGSNANDSFLLSYDNVIRLSELREELSLDPSNGNSLELLTLSACDTATGDDRAPLGFAGAGIKAGARSVIGTLWAVNDRATQPFMLHLYAGLSRGKALALAEAQRSLIQSADFSHPYFWAPFVLTGDWN